MSLPRFVFFLAAWIVPAAAMQRPSHARPKAPASASPFFPLQQVRPGLTGYGRTVFRGRKIQTFKVKILGVAPDMGPRQAVIWAQLSGGPLAETGLIEGMSGSPVYIDGKLLGAVALGYPFAKTALAGITPIDQMVRQAQRARTPRPGRRALPRATPSPARPFGAARLNSPWGAAAWRRWRQWLYGAPSENSDAADGPGLPVLNTPLSLAGFSASTIRHFLPRLSAMQMTPLATAGGGGPQPAMPAHPRVTPGEMISVQLMRGDLAVSADGTVTYVHGKDIYAFGHRFLAAGAAAFPFSRSHVLALMPGLQTSFKIDVPGAPLGVIRQDRSQGVYGVLGARVRMIPVRINVLRRDGQMRHFQFQVVNHPFLTPLLVNMGVFSVLDATQRALGPSTLRLTGAVQIGGSAPVRLNNLFSGDLNLPTEAAAGVANPIAELYASGLPHLDVTGVDLTIQSRRRKQTARIEQVWANRGRLRPGSPLRLEVALRTSSGHEVLRHLEARLPASTAAGPLVIEIGGGMAAPGLGIALAPPLAPARSLRQLVRQLNRVHRNNRIYLRILQPAVSYHLAGASFPLAPPSLARLLSAGGGLNSAVEARPQSLLLRARSAALPYAVTGTRQLTIMVRHGY